MKVFDNEIAAEFAREKKRAPEHIEGIKCDVKSCAFHDGDNYCCAREITVGPGYATERKETVCATYRRKNI